MEAVEVEEEAVVVQAVDAVAVLRRQVRRRVLVVVVFHLAVVEVVQRALAEEDITEVDQQHPTRLEGHHQEALPQWLSSEVLF